MKAIGCNVTSKAIYFIEFTRDEQSTIIKVVARLDTPPTDAPALARTLETVKALLSPSTPTDKRPFQVAFYGCQDGRMGSSIEAIKSEAIIQLAANELGLEVRMFHPSSFINLFKNEGSGKWDSRARQFLDSKEELPYWHQGLGAAVCAAYKALNDAEPS